MVSWVVWVYCVYAVSGRRGSGRLSGNAANGQAEVIIISVWSVRVPGSGQRHVGGAGLHSTVAWWFLGEWDFFVRSAGTNGGAQRDNARRSWPRNASISGSSRMDSGQWTVDTGLDTGHWTLDNAVVGEGGSTRRRRQRGAAMLRRHEVAIAGSTLISTSSPRSPRSPRSRPGEVAGWESRAGGRGGCWSGVGGGRG